MTGEVQVTLSATDFTSVKVWCTKMDHNLDKNVVAIPVARQKAAMVSGALSVTYLIDLGRVKEIIVVQGILYDETTESAQEKKDYIIDMARNCRAVTITWGTGSREQEYTGNISKIGVTETAGIIGLQKTGYESEKNFAVQFSILIGEDKLGEN